MTVTQGGYATLRHPKIHAYTKFGIPTSNNIRDMLRGQGHSDPKMVRNTPPSHDACTQNLGFLSQITQEICYRHDYSENKARGQGHSDPKMVHDTQPSQNVFIHQIWNSYLKKYRRYAPDSMPILETRSEVKVTDVHDTPPSHDASTHQI